MTTLEYLKKLFRDDPVLSHYDISEGSNYYDLVWTTLNKVLNESVTNGIIGQADIYDLNKMDALTYNDVATIAAQYGIPAPFVNYASGDVKLVFNTPVDVTLPAGTVFESNGIQFVTTSYETILARYLESNVKTSDGKYQSQPITVYNSGGRNVGANTLGLTSLAIPELARIENDEINNGSAGSSKEIIASLIKATIRGINNGTEESLSALMRTLYPSLIAVQVITGDDELMTRDLVVNAYVYGAPTNNQQSYFNKVYGNNSTNKNIAYKGVAYTAEPPDIDSLYGKTELSQYQYINIGSNDASPLLISTDNEFLDTFSTYNNLGASGELDCGAIAGDDYFYAYGAYWIEPGSSVNLEGDDSLGVLHKTQVIVREVHVRAYDIVSVAATADPSIFTITLDSSAAEVANKLKAGQMIDIKWIRIPGNADYSLDGVAIDNIDVDDLTFDIISSSPITTGDCDELYPGKAIWSEYQIIGKFSVTLEEVLASVPDDISTQIGNGWVVSEHGYPIGMKVANNEVYIEDERVVMGGNTGSIEDPLRDIIAKGGVGRFVASVLRSISIKRTGDPVTEQLPIVNSEEMYR